MTKILIFDSSVLINFILNGLLDLLVELKKNFPGKFIITKDVKYETVDRPLQIKKFELAALRMQGLIDEKILEMPSSIGIDEQVLDEKTKKLLETVNRSFFADDYMHIIDSGEASCLALSLLANEKGIENMIAIDERTTRMLVEGSENLRKLFESKLHTKVKLKNGFSFLNNIRFIRSSELVYIAYKKGLIKIRNNALDALLYATKFKGCAISSQEIEQMKKL